MNTFTRIESACTFRDGLSFLRLVGGSNKFDCLIKEMLFIRKLKPSLNFLICSYVFIIYELSSADGSSTTFENKSSHCRVARQGLPYYTAVARLGFKRRATAVLKSNLIRSI